MSNLRETPRHLLSFSVMVNGLPVEASYSERSVEEIFLPLLRHLTRLQKEKGRRILVMLAAPPGAGKTTLLSFLKHLSETTEGVMPITTIGMDGFHRYQDYLLTHTTERDGETIPMVKIKGAPITFDLELLTERVKRVAAGEECGWPEYDRLKHNPQEDAVTVVGDIIFLEGNYLLLADEGWCDLKKYADVTIRISAEESSIKDRLVRRKAMTGTTMEEAVKFVEYSDLVNAKACLTRSVSADYELYLMPNGEYVIQK